MTKKALFAGLISDQYERPVPSSYVGEDAVYVVDDDGFQRHIDSEFVDRQVLNQLREAIQGHEEIITEGTMKMLGQDDIFTKAMIESSLENIGDQFDVLLASGLPEEARAWLGMSGFRVVIDEHGQVLSVEQPSASEDGEG
jgi:hypothetical protein